MLTELVPLLVLFMVALLVAFSTVKILKEYERGVVFRLGRLIPLRGRASSSSFPSGWTT